MIPFFLVSLLSLSATDAGPPMLGPCRVVDGDTLRCGKERIRLIGIDAPELPGHCRSGRRCAPGDPIASKASLKRGVAGRLTITRTGTDHYGRTLALVSGARGDLSCWQLRNRQAHYRPDWDNGRALPRSALAMSRLHSLRASIEDVAGFLHAEPPETVAVPADVTEGRQGLVMFEAGGRRRLRMMRWGFPRHIRDVRLQGKEADIIGLVADLTNPMWEQTVVDPRYRCIIPITHFGNPDGDAGAKTRTWFARKDQPIMAWAGFCRNIPDVGPCYAGMTMEANAAIPPTNDRMPVLLEADEHAAWLHGNIQDVIRFQFRAPVAAERMDRIVTDDPWRGGGPPPAGEQLGLL